MDYFTVEGIKIAKTWRDSPPHWWMGKCQAKEDSTSKNIYFINYAITVVLSSCKGRHLLTSGTQSLLLQWPRPLERPYTSLSGHCGNFAGISGLIKILNSPWKDNDSPPLSAFIIQNKNTIKVKILQSSIFFLWLWWYFRYLNIFKSLKKLQLSWKHVLNSNWMI